MRIALDEACNCRTPRPGYPRGGVTPCVVCGFYIIKALRRKRLKRVQGLNIRNEFQDARKRTKGGLPVNGVPTHIRSQRG